MFGGSFVIAVTGAQGVGKSTFCRSLVAALGAAEFPGVALLDGLRQSIQSIGVPFGSASTSETIFAVWVAHLEREASSSDAIVILDRCCIDALAYTRVLDVSSPLERRLFERVAELAATRLNLIVHLKLSPFFKERGADHETPELRIAVAREIEAVLIGIQTRRLDIDAVAQDAVANVVSVVREMLDAR